MFSSKNGISWRLFAVPLWWSIIPPSSTRPCPTTTVIEKASGRKVQAVPVQEFRHKQETAVVSRQRTTAAASEEKIPTPAGNEVRPAKQKVASALESPQAQKPDSVTHEMATPVPKNGNGQSETHKSIPEAAESKSAANTPAKPEGNNPPVINEPKGKNAGQQAGKQQKPAQPPDKKEQEPAGNNPAANDNNGAPPPADKGHDKKPNE
jgi:hypothetical protein